MCLWKQPALGFDPGPRPASCVVWGRVLASLGLLSPRRLRVSVTTDGGWGQGHAPLPPQPHSGPQLTAHMKRWREAQPARLGTRREACRQSHAALLAAGRPASSVCTGCSFPCPFRWDPDGAGHAPPRTGTSGASSQCQAPCAKPTGKASLFPLFDKRGDQRPVTLGFNFFSWAKFAFLCSSPTPPPVPGGWGRPGRGRP